MDKFLHSRVFRLLVCLILVCCILVNASPLHAEASVVVGSVITGTGLFATLFALSMGVVFVDLTADLINGLGKSFENHVTSNVGTDESEILKVWIEPLQVDLDSGGISQLPPEQDDDNNNWAMLAGVLSVPESLLDNFCDWGEQLINDDGVEVEDPDIAPEGFAYYNGFLFPDIPNSSYRYWIMGYTTSYTTPTPVLFGLSDSASPYLVSFESSNNGETYHWLRMYCKSDGGKTSVIRYKLSSNSSKWEYDWSYSSASEQFSSIVWANWDLSTNDGSFILDYSEPTSYKTKEVRPIYVGDIPSQVKGGSFDDEKYELPYINYTQLFQNQTDAIEALNNAATQLQNQTMTYQQYMDLIQTQTGSGTNPDPDPNPDPGTDPDDPEQDPEQDPDDGISNFTLDLKDYFPFCIPFDLYDFVSCLNAAPEAPVIEWEIYTSGGGSYPLVLDLSPFDSAAQLLRRLELLLFCIGLGFVTRNLIKG